MNILSQFVAAIKPANRGNSAVGGGFAESQRRNGIRENESATRAAGILPTRLVLRMNWPHRPRISPRQRVQQTRTLWAGSFSAASSRAVTTSGRLQASL